MKNKNLKTLIIVSIISTIAYITMYIFRVPVPPFLEYEFKDVVISLGGILLGILPLVIISFLVSFLELITISPSGIVGFFMNITSTLSFSLPIIIFYKKLNSIKGLAIGCFVGTLCMAFSMVFFNYIITPIYMGVARSEVVALLVPLIIPFNFIKGILNSFLILILYKPFIYKLIKKLN